MTQVSVSPNNPNCSHDLSLSSRGVSYGLTFAPGFSGMQRVPITGTSTLFNFEQTSWGGGRGRLFAKTDPTGYYDANHAWCLQEGKLFAVPQIRHAKGLRNEDTFFPGDGTTSTVWKALYAQGAARYMSVAFTASASYNADYVRLIIRRIGKPGDLTVEINANSAGSPGAAAKTVTLAASAVEPNSIISLTHRYKFDWTTTTALTASTDYHIKAYGASGDTVDNHWEVLVDTGSSGSKTSTDNSSWSAASWKMYYRVCDADIKRRLHPFFFYGGWYVVTTNDDASSSKIYINGDTGTVASATSTTLVKTSAGWTVNRWSGDGAYVYLYAGTGEGQLRSITSNTATELTVPTWDVTPDTTTKFAIIKTRWWKEVTTSGTALGVIKDAPAVMHSVCLFPRGAGTDALRMTNAFVCSVETNVAADQFEMITNTNALSLWGAIKSTAKLYQYTIPDSLTGITIISKLAVTRTIGTSDYQITNMLVHDKKLYVFKENKMYSVQGTNSEEVSIALHQMPSRLNGLAAASHQSYLYFSWAASVERMIQTNASDILNFRPSYDGFVADRKSYPVAMASLLGWVIAAFDGGASYKSSVMLWNDAGWMEMVRGYEVGARIRDMFTQTSYEQRPRLYTNMDGDLIYQDMPLNDNNPLQDTGARFEHEFSLITGAIDGNEAAFNKLVNKIQFLTQSLGTTGTIAIDYQTDSDVWTTNWKPLNMTVTKSPRQDVLLNFGKINKIAFRFRVYTTTPSTPTVLNGYRIEGWKVDDVRRQWVVRLSTGYGQQTRLSESDHNPKELLAWLADVAKNLQELELHSQINIFDGKKVFIHEPSIGTDSGDSVEWQGTYSLMIREAGE